MHKRWRSYKGRKRESKLSKDKRKNSKGKKKDDKDKFKRRGKNKIKEIKPIWIRVKTRKVKNQ